MVNIFSRPDNFIESHLVARSVLTLSREKISGSVMGGNILLGYWYSGALDVVSSYAAIKSPDVIKFCDLLFNHNTLKIPRVVKSKKVKLVELGELGKRGPVHRDIYGEKGRSRFKRLGRILSDPTYPFLCNHDKNKEQTFIVDFDDGGEIAEGMEEKAELMWKNHSTRLHYSLGFRLNSQSHSACITPSPCLGGASWPGVRVNNER